MITFLDQLSLTDRKFSLEQTEQRLHEELIQSGLKHSLISLGDTVFSCKKATIIKTNSPNDYTGYGKGSQRSAKVGAVFEALENYHAANLSQHQSLTTISYNELLPENKTLIQSYCPIQIITNDTLSSTPLSHIPFVNYSVPQHSILVPAVAIHHHFLDQIPPEDHFPYNEVYLQNGSNGIASGAEFDDALCHSICEVLERDAISKFIIDVLIHQRLEQMFVVKPDSLDSHESEMLQQATTIIGRQPILVYCPSDTAIPCFGAFVRYGEEQIMMRGFGASVDKQYALYRAIAECIEQFYQYDSFVLPEYHHGIQQFAPYPILQRCVEFPVDTYLCDASMLDYQQISSPKKDCQTLDFLLACLKKSKKDLYTTTLYQSANICIVSSLIAGTENLFPLVKGLFPAMTKKTLAALNPTLDTASKTIAHVT